MPFRKRWVYCSVGGSVLHTVCTWSGALCGAHVLPPVYIWFAGWVLAGCWVGRVMGTSPGGVWGLGVKNVMENGIEIQNRLSHLLHYCI